MENITLTGVDLSKHSFQVRSENHAGRMVVSRAMNRERFNAYLGELPKGSIVAMEACGSSHYWARECQERGLEPKLISPQFVKPFRKSQKNDRNDAEAICEAARRPTMRFVAVKTPEQQMTQQLHQVRERLIRDRTALMNQVRGFFAERGVAIPKSIKSFKETTKKWLGQCQEERLFYFLLSQSWEEFCAVDAKVTAFTKEIEHIFRTNESCQMIKKVRGIGPVTSTAAVASMGNPHVFRNGRCFASLVGLVPQQFSTGGRTTLGHISKRGDKYLRKLLIHGARAAVRSYLRTTGEQTKESLWVQQLHRRCGTNRTVVALANKNARTIWAILAGKQPRKEQKPAIAA